MVIYMKGLMHSKKFRANLRKWLCMYISVLILLTVVVTYSKYLASLPPISENASIAKFNVDIDIIGCTSPLVPIEVCENGTEEEDCEKQTSYICSDTEEQRPTKEMNYRFSVDTRQLDVKTKVLVKVKVDSHFTIKDIKNVTDPLAPVPVELKDASGENVISLGDIKDGILYIWDVIPAGGALPKEYNLTIIYDNKQVENDNYSLTDGYDYEKIVTIGYSAKQVIE